MFGYLVVWFLPRQAAEPSGLVVLLFVSRADARDTRAALLIRGGAGAAAPPLGEVGRGLG